VLVETRRYLEIIDWGRLDYGQALSRQLAMAAERADDRAPDRLVLVEHPPVVTVGRSGGGQDLLAPLEELRLAGLDFQEVDRGGQATYHGPGQLVVYPIVKLGRKDLHAYLDGLLETVAGLLEEYGLAPERKAGQPGLWVNSAKIVSVGLAVRRWVTYHGLALNVNNDLSGFGYIVPCGHPGERITSLSETLGRPLDLGEVKDRLAARFVRNFNYRTEAPPAQGNSKHPAWLVRQAPDTGSIKRMEARLDQLRLATVCQSAHCPNLGECFQQGTATFMILGRNCTRNCRFCAVDKKRPDPLDPDEAQRVAQAAESLGLRHVVVTSVTRDDLPDGGAGQFAATIGAVRRSCPGAMVEVLIPDFRGSVQALDLVVAARPDVFNHNLETVPRLYASIRPQAGYRRSLAVLRHAADYGLAVKSGLMLGLGETDAELLETLRDLKRAGCVYLTLGQYLAPSAAHAPVVRWVSPEEFDDWADQARRLGFGGVASGPLVRSSYRAGELFEISNHRPREGHGGQEAIYC
jgi:lipoic acid synthetase